MKTCFKLFLIVVSLSASAQQKSLEYFLGEAMKNSPLFIDNANQVASLKYDSLRIRSLLKPQVNFNSNDFYAPVVNGYGYDRAITNGGALTGLVGANLTVVGSQNLDNQYRSIQLQGQSLLVAGKLSEKDLKQAVTAQYIGVYGEQEMLHNTESVLDVLENENSILKKLAEDGVYKETDYLSFLVNYRQQQLSYRQRMLQLKNDLAILNYSCGISDTTLTELEKPPMEEKNALQPELTLSFRQFMIDSLILQNNYDKVKFAYKPHLSLYGDAGYNSSLTYQSEKNFGASAGLNLVVPIYDGKQRALTYEKIKLSESTRTGYMQFYKKQYSQKVLQLRQQIKSTDDLLAEAQKQIGLSDALVQANRKLLITGDAKMADYILALTNYIAAQSTLVQLRISGMLLMNEYNYINY